MICDIYRSEQEAKRLLLWPIIPALHPFPLEACQNPGKLKAPAAHYDSVTRVYEETQRGFPAVLPLEPSLNDLFFGRRRPTYPSSHDQVITRLISMAMAAIHTVLNRGGGAVSHYGLDEHAAT